MMNPQTLGLAAVALAGASAPATAQDGPEVLWEELVEIELYAETGEPIAAWRYFGTEAVHEDGERAAALEDGVYRIWREGGGAALELSWDDGVQLVARDAEGEVAFTCASDGAGTGWYPTGRPSWHVSGGKFQSWHESGQLAVDATLAQGIWRAWGVGVEIDPWQRYWESAAQELARSAVPRFAAGLAHPNPWVRVYVAEGLASLGMRARPAVRRLRETLSDDSWLARQRAARALGGIGAAASDAVPELLALLGSGEERDIVRAEAALALGRIGPPASEAAGPLRDLAASGETPRALRAAAIEALGGLGPAAAGALAALREVAEGGDRRLAARALASVLRIDPATTAEIGALARLLEDGGARVDAARALGEFRQRSLPARAALVKALEEAQARWGENAAEAHAVAFALHRVDPAAPELARWSLAEPSPHATAVAMPELFALLLIEVDPEETRGLLRTLLDHEELSMRRGAWEYLNALGPEAAAAAPALASMLGELSPSLREWALEALARVGEPALPALRAALEDERPLARWSAARGLARLGAAAVPALVEALGSPEEPVRFAAARGLGTIGAPAEEAVPALERMLADPGEGARWVAAEALGKIRGP